jgi:hypothetical protein
MGSSARSHSGTSCLKTLSHGLPELACLSHACVVRPGFRSVGSKRADVVHCEEFATGALEAHDAGNFRRVAGGTRRSSDIIVRPTVLQLCGARLLWPAAA